MLLRFIIIGTVISLIIVMMWWNRMKKLHFKLYRYILNPNYYPLNIWISFLLGFVRNFLFLLIFNTFFLNFVTNSDFIEGVMYSFLFTFIIMFFRIIGLLNPFELFRFLYDTIEKITDEILLRIIKFFRIWFPLTSSHSSTYHRIGRFP